MVAYTSPDCLPYFECSDSACLNTGTACEHSTVFCDLVALLDTRLTGFANVVARTNTAIPFAKVARTSNQEIDTNVVGYDNRVIWDTVLADNFDMVDLTANPKEINIPEAGLWLVTGYVNGFPSVVVSNIFQMSLGSGVGTFQVEQDSLYRGNFTSNYNNAVSQFELTPFQLAANGGKFPISMLVDLSGTIGDGIVTVQSAEMTVYWIGETP